MRAFRFPPVLFVLLSGACTAPPPSPFTGAQRDSLALEVRGVMADLTEAMNAHDPDRVLSFYRESEEFVYLGCTSLLFGSETFAVRVGPYYTNTPDVTFEQEILRIQVLSPTTAVVTLQGNSTDADALFWTEVLTRESDGRWLIAHEHESWPGCPDAPPLHPTGMPEDPGGVGS